MNTIARWSSKALALSLPVLMSLGSAGSSHAGPIVAESNARVSVVGSLVTVFPTESPAGSAIATITAARNEFQSFQVVVKAASTPIHHLSVNLDQPLARSGGGAISEDNVTIYREAYYNVQQPSDSEGKIGRWPDALIPSKDPFYGEQRNAFPIDVPAGENRVAWIDVLVPKGAIPGTYTGSLRVTADGLNVRVPVQLQVINATLPSTSSMPSAFGMSWDNVCWATYGKSCFTPPYTEEDGWRLKALYVQAALDNRISIDYPQYQPLTSGNRGLFRKYILPLLNGTSSTRLPGARLTSFQIDAENAGQVQAWRDEARADGFADRAFVYICDEPGSDGSSWDRCKQKAQLARSVWPEVRTLVTATIQDAGQQQALGSISRLVSIVNYMDDKPGNSPYAGNQRSAYDAWQRSDPRNQVWLYTSCMSHGCGNSSPTCLTTGPATRAPYFTGWPGYVIDEPASEQRAMGWLSFLYRTTGELYYQVDQCLSWTQQFAFGGNGDGTLFYPGTTNVIGGQHPIPIESLRLKRIRDGYQDYEYLRLAQQQGKGNQACAIAHRLFPADRPECSDMANGSMYHTNPPAATMEAAHLELAQLITSGHPGPTVRMTSPADGATVSGTIRLSATASASAGIASVQFLVDGAAVGAEIRGAPYTEQLNTRNLTNGAHQLVARARDTTGTIALSPPVHITVRNQPGKLTLVRGLGLSPTSPMVNQTVTASYTVQNTGGQALTIPYLLVGARDPSGANVDFCCVAAISLQPGQQYVYRQSRAFSRAGRYSAWPAAYLNGAWVELGPHSAFSVRPSM